MARNQWTTGISGFCMGLGLGAVAGILFAPKSGKETRKRITNTTKETLNGIVDHGDEIVSEVKEGVDGAFGQGAKLVRRAATTVERTKEHLTDAIAVGERAYLEAKKASA